MAPRGKTLLKVSGILYIILAAIRIVVGLVTVLGGGLIAAAGGMSSEVGALGMAAGGAVLLVGLGLILSSVYNLVVGIFGVKYAAVPAKANVCFVLGIISVVFSSFDFLGALYKNSSSGEFLGAILMLALGICYIVGASWNKQDASTPMN